MRDNQIGQPRRTLVGGVGATTSTAGALSANAQPAGKTLNAAPLPLEDPRNKYPKPPFPEQHQPWPGLTAVVSRPDRSMGRRGAPANLDW